MSTFTQGINDIRFLAARFKGLMAAAEALEQFGAIETAITEAQQRLDALRQQEEQEKLVSEQRTAEALRSIDGILADARAEADEIRTAATRERDAVHTDRDGIIDGAHQRAVGIIKVAQEEAAEIREKVETHRSQLTGLLGFIRQRETERDALLVNLENAKAEHARVSKMISDLKAKF